MKQMGMAKMDVDGTSMTETPQQWLGYGIQYGRENKDDGNGNGHHLRYENW